MNLLKLVFISILLFSSTYASSQNNPQKTKVIEELLTTLKIKESLQETITQVLDIQLQTNPAAKPYRQTFLDFYSKYMSYQSLKPELIEIYSKTFTVTELKELNTFYKSRTGQKIIDKLPMLMKQASEIGMKHVKDNLVELQRMIQKETAHQKELEKSLRIPTELSDTDLESLIVGKWYMSPKDTYFKDGNAIISYSKDHSHHFIGYSDVNCTNKNLDVFGTWRIQDKKLIITVEKSKPENIFIPGEIITDVILSMTDNTKKMVSTENTHIQYRTKKNTCIDH